MSTYFMPEFTQLLVKFASSIGKWVAQGAKVVPEDVYNKRYEACLNCTTTTGGKVWDPKGYNNLGRCNVCGCSRLKLFMDTESCPANPKRWDKHE